MNNEDVLDLLPKIKRAANFLARNGCDPDDLEQYAILRLLAEDRIIADNPMITVVSTMKDYVLTHGLQYNSKYRKRVFSEVALVVATSHYKDYTPDWDDIPFTEEEREFVRLHCELGWSHRKIAKKYGVSEMHPLRVLRRAATKAVTAWGLETEEVLV